LKLRVLFAIAIATLPGCAWIIGVSEDVVSVADAGDASSEAALDANDVAIDVLTE
jgi:hypothetical protein